GALWYVANTGVAAPPIAPPPPPAVVQTPPISAPPPPVPSPTPVPPSAPPPAPTQQGRAVAVTIADFEFRPATLNVGVGATVTWTNDGPSAHTATSDSGMWDTGRLNRGQSGSYTFTTAGTFTYHCAIHPTMHGTIVVGGGGSTAGQPQPSQANPSPGYGGQPGYSSGATNYGGYMGGYGGY